MSFGYLLAMLAIAAFLWLAHGVRRIGAVSRGKPIGDRTGTALLLVDLQSVFWDRGPYSVVAKLSTEAAILREVDAARAQGDPVVAVRQEWSIPSTKAVARLTMKGQAVEGSSGTELADPFARLVDHVVVKRVQDAFETGELDALLEELGVGKLRIAGLDLNHCVQKTALAARNRGYEVAVVIDGTLSAAPTERAKHRMTSHGVAFQ